MARLLSRGVPALVVGDRQDVNEVLTYVKDTITDSRLCEMDLVVPTTGYDPKASYYRYRRYRMVFISRAHPAWKV